MDKPWLASNTVFLVSVTILATLTIHLGASKKFQQGGDADQYLAIAKSVAHGNGYKDTVGFWPDSPAYDRMPGWPTITMVGLRLAPNVSPEAVSRLINAVCLALAGAYFCTLSQRLGIRPVLSIPSGLAISLSPSLIYLSVEGMSEVSFVMVMAMGLTGLFSGRRGLYWGAFILGMGPLIRTNFILVPPLLLGLAFLLPDARHSLLSHRNLSRIALAFCLSLLPSLLWVARNYSVSGRFPLLSSIQGETLYGANNAVVANNLPEWGYWIMPDRIPGETSKLKLAKSLSTDLALNDYYQNKAHAWIKDNWTALPRLILGKFIRAFVPVPWVPTLPSYVVFFFRFLLYAFALALLPFWWRGMNRGYLLFLASMSVAHVVTTIVYYGAFRLTHCFIEVLLVPLIFYGLQQRMDKVKIN